MKWYNVIIPYLIGFFSSLTISETILYLFSKRNYTDTNLIWNYVYLTKIYNDWIWLWIDINRKIMLAMTLFLVVLMVYYFIKYEDKKDTTNSLWYWLLLWWALSNLYERLFIWEVFDYIALKWFFVFNMADFFIFVGIVLIIYNEFRKKWLDFDHKK